MTIRAKFASICPTCGERIEIGTVVEWERGQKATHVDCEPKAEEPQVEPKRIAVEDQGVYVLASGDIVKVQANRAKTRTYAKRWVEIRAERSLEAGGRAHGEWSYEPGLVNEVAESGRKMTLDEAKAFILRYGQCVRCGRHLKAAESVERGIGPVCIRYFGSPVQAAAPSLPERNELDEEFGDPFEGVTAEANPDPGDLGHRTWGGDCPACGKPAVILKSGKLVAHTNGKRGRQLATCPASGMRPATATILYGKRKGA